MLKTFMTRYVTIAFACSLFSAYAMADGTKRAIYIPSGDLAIALELLARQSGTDLVYRPDQVQGFKTGGVEGELSTEEAVTKLLTGTPLTLSVDSTGAILIALPTASPPNDAPQASMNTPESKSFRSRLRLAQTETPAPLQGEGRGEVTMGEGERAAQSPKVIELEEIVVTGTHIRGGNPASQVITIDRNEIERSGYSTLGDMIRSLPQNFSGGVNPGIVAANAPGNDGNTNPAGLSAPNLRGLGPGSTLTLVNGRRVAQGLPNGAGDISFVPLDAVERIEVVADGASAIYGSDAVAGVVNVILKEQYDGVQVRASLGRATNGGGDDRQVSTIAGTSWDSGGAYIAYKRADQEEVLASERDFAKSASVPYWILPEISADSVYLSANQDLTNSISAHFEGYYDDRESNALTSFPGFGVFGTPTDYRHYGGTLGMEMSLLADWTLSMYAMTAVQFTTTNGYTQPFGSDVVTYMQPTESNGRNRSFEMTASGPLFRLRDEPALLALGAGYRNEFFARGFTGAVPNFDRDVRYAFSELAVPVLTGPSTAPQRGRLDLIASGRYEDYSDVGHEAVPNLGVRYSPIESLRLRASWSKSFRAPTLSDLNARSTLALNNIRNPAAPSGRSAAIIRGGGNPDLNPETSTSWSVGFEFAPPNVRGLRLKASYFDIRYEGRITNMANAPAALVDPVYSYFVLRQPSVEFQQSLLNAIGGAFTVNTTGQPYDPATVVAVVDNRRINVSRQDARGIDFGLDYQLEVGASEFNFFFNGAYLKLQQLTSPSAQEQTISGAAFNPPRFRARGGAEWGVNGWSLTGIVNYLSSETNIYVPERSRVGSWTTVDLSVAYVPSVGGIFADTRLSVSAQNVFDKAPPFLVFDTFNAGLNYDSLNVTPLGRFLSVQVSKAW